mmetsp:Transcript_168518/g.298668  ORF Transcript_168518/g.298668 Transcript_168518/m.298668 type:complete len:370 (+) Transcript_168518:47-1156(+)
MGAEQTRLCRADGQKAAEQSTEARDLPLDVQSVVDDLPPLFLEPEPVQADEVKVAEDKTPEEVKKIQETVEAVEEVAQVLEAAPAPEEAHAPEEAKAEAEAQKEPEAKKAQAPLAADAKAKAKAKPTVVKKKKPAAKANSAAHHKEAATSHTEEETSKQAPEEPVEPPSEPSSEPSSAKKKSKRDPSVVSTSEDPPSGVPLYFDNKPYYFQHKPVGIKFFPKAPIRIEGFNFNSYGKTLGLEVGMQLTKINNEDVHANHKFSDVEHKVHAAIGDLPWWPLHIVFKTVTGEIKGIDFVRRPLGIQFTRHLPIKIENFKPHSYAQEMGCELDWEIVKIADEKEAFQDSKKAFNMVNEHLHEGLNHLPEKKK